MGDNRSALGVMRAVREGLGLKTCSVTEEDLNNKLNEDIKRQNDYFHQEYMHEPSECNIIKNVDVNGDDITFTTEDGSKFSVNAQNITIGTNTDSTITLSPTKSILDEKLNLEISEPSEPIKIADTVRPNKQNLLPKFVDASILKDIGSSIIPTAGTVIAEVYDNENTCKLKLGDGSTPYDKLPYVLNSDSSVYEICKPVKSESSTSNEDSGINVEKLMMALRDIYDKYKKGYRDGFEIKRMIDLLKSDNIMKESMYHYQMVIRSVETFLDRSKYKISPNELMVIYYGMYILRIKGNEMLRKLGVPI
jgi:hypothetical protein